VVRLVLFDIDGTLVHTGHAGTRAFSKTFAMEFGLHHGAERMRFAGRTDTNLVREFFGIHGTPASPENFRRFFDHYVFWLEHIVSQNTGKECPGVRKFIGDLLALPNPPMLGLLTGNIQLGAEIKLRQFGLWEIFEMGGFADDHEDRNYIAAAAHKRGCRVLKRELRGEEIVVIGDTPFDVRCGKFIGAKVLAVATGGATLEELKNHKPDWAVENLSDVSAHQIMGLEGRNGKSDTQAAGLFALDGVAPKNYSMIQER
jgi:phosphoglycolate phosphatase-like HAD superfamily hydrolase